MVVDLRNLAFFEQLAALYQQLIEGESSGLSQLQVDQVKSRVLPARPTLIGDIVNLRNPNDQFKQQLGLPPDTPMVPDVSLFQPYLDMFAVIDEWQRRARTGSWRTSPRSSTGYPPSRTSCSMVIPSWGRT